LVERLFRSPLLKQVSNEVEWAVLGSVRVSGESIELEGDDNLIDFSIPVVSLRTGELVLFEQDREEWARNLPNAYRAGDYVVEVYRDDEPLPPEALAGPEIEREPITLRDRTRVYA
jgi:hypothetical protein